MKPTLRAESLSERITDILNLSDNNFVKRDLILSELAQVEAKARLNLLNEVRELVEKQKLGTYKEWVGATRKYGGTREEWEKLNNRGHDRVIDDLLSALDKLEGEK